MCIPSSLLNWTETKPNVAVLKKSIQFPCFTHSKLLLSDDRRIHVIEEKKKNHIESRTEMSQLRHQLELISVTVSHRLTDSCLNLWDSNLSQNEKLSLITDWKASWQTLALSVSKQSTSITVGDKSHIWLASKPKSGSHVVQSERIRWGKVSLTLLNLKTSPHVSVQ